ncbi:hypothetical protein [Flavobacterium sp.]|jgi:hypothetical protein|uniref:hypothetical protein n=1 Tax=Flavobacterium sp. TaxID=239 RepID=UPI0037BEE252
MILENKTNDTIFFDMMFSDERIEWNPLVKKDGKIDSTISQFMRPKEIKSRAVMGTWEEQIYRMAKDSAIRIYFFKKELVENVSKDTFLKRQAYSKKYKLTVKDLERMKWQVIYEEK